MATIYDVAARAGVSASTVSRVFKNSPRISAETRERVLREAAALQFQPSPRASATAGQSPLIGLVIPDILNPYAASLARGMQDSATSQGAIPIICSSGISVAQELHLLREITRRGIDGLIITPPQYQISAETNQFIEELLAQRLPIVFIGNRLDSPAVDFVTSRAQDGAIQAVNHLVGLGHRKIAFIGGHYTQGIAVGRWLGYQEAIIASRLPLRPEYMLEADLSQEGGRAAMAALLALPDPPTAVFTVNDVTAIGALLLCQERGVGVPEQLSIIGFDDIPLAAMVIPPLTTVAQPAYEIGFRAAELLLERSRQPDAPPQQVSFPCRLMARGTTAPPG